MQKHINVAFLLNLKKTKRCKAAWLPLNLHLKVCISKVTYFRSHEILNRLEGVTCRN